MILGENVSGETGGSQMGRYQGKLCWDVGLVCAVGVCLLSVECPLVVVWVLGRLVGGLYEGMGRGLGLGVGFCCGKAGIVGMCLVVVFVCHDSRRVV